MKKIFSIVAVMFVAICMFTFAGCAITLSGGPSKTDAVTGNGGLSVRKGDYLYFVNGYVSNTSLKGADNSYGNCKNGAIYRAQLENGKLMYDITLDEEENEVKTLKNVELLVPKVAGFEYTSLYIYENTLYFSSPNTEKDREGKIRFDYTDIFAVSIKGGNPTKIANALNISTKDSFSITSFENNVYVNYLENNNLYNVKVKGTKVLNRKLISSSCSSFAVFEGNVYYTRGFNDNEHNITGNVLAKAELKTSLETILTRDNKNTFTIKKVDNNKIYYTRTNDLITNSYIYSKNIENFVQSDEKQYTAVAYTSNQYIFDVDGYANGVLVNENNKLLFLTGINDLEEDITSLYEGTFTYLGMKGEFVYGKDTDGNLVRINVHTQSLETLLSKDTEFYMDMNSNFDIENGYVYYYVKYTGENEETGYYLNRLYLNDSEKESEFLGVMLEKHIKDEEE